ncbi:MAG: hypothetical protein LBK23_11765 [Oscillospiraceae bacterium]|jgi:hypothetical protein|nr:hypothetical protein [Oscillospiraceae bacterium]
MPILGAEIRSVGGGQAKLDLGLHEAPIKQKVRQLAQSADSDPLIKLLFKQTTQNTILGTYASQYRVGQHSVINEHGADHVVGRKQGFNKNVGLYEFGSKTPITWKMDRFSQENEGVAAANDLGGAARDAKLRYAALMIANAIAGNASFEYGGENMYTTTSDGVTAFSTAHPYKDAALTGTQSNIFSDTLSVDSLIGIASVASKFSDDSGNAIDSRPKAILIPATAAAEKQAAVISGSLQLPGTSNNDLNPLHNTFEYYKSVEFANICKQLGLIASESSATFPYIVFDPDWISMYNSSIYAIADPLNVVTYQTGPSPYSGWTVEAHEMYSFSFVDWRGFTVGGVAAGIPLSSV